MPPAASMRPDSTLATGGGHFKAMKQKLVSGDSPVPALVDQRPAPSSQDNSSDETLLESVTTVVAEPNLESAALTVETPQAATTPPSAGGSTGPKRRLRTGGSKTKLKLALGEELEQRSTADSTLHAATLGDDALIQRRKSKTALAVGKDLRGDHVRVGATQEMIQAMSAQAEHRKVEEEAIRTMEQDLKNLHQEELRAKNGAVKHFFTDTIPGLFNKPDTAASRSTELEDEYADEDQWSVHQ